MSLDNRYRRKGFNLLENLPLPNIKDGSPSRTTEKSGAQQEKSPTLSDKKKLLDT